jgi:uncharacterized membrane protein YheB (UPF0754 family)
MTSFAHILPYLAPPLLGAFIGYVTNYIAIRMLFRPLKPWRLFGIRLPLTPGIIPAKRHELATRMGEMVGSHLLTSADVGSVLERDSFRRELKGAVADKLGGFLDRELGPVESLVPVPYRGRFRDLVALLRWKAVSAVFSYLESADFEQRLTAYLQRGSRELLARDLASYLTPEREASLRRHLDERIGAFLASPEVARSVAVFVDERTERWFSSPRPLRELLPADLVELVLVQLDKEVPPLLERFGGLLYDPEFRERLVKKAKVGINAFLDSLGGLSGLLSGFLNMDKIYARIPEFLDKAGDEIARWLREKSTQEQVSALLHERIDGLLDKPLGSFLDKLPYEKVAALRRFMREQTVALATGRRSAEALLALAERGLSQVKDRSFASLGESLLPAGSLERAGEALIAQLLTTLRSPAARQGLDEILQARSEEWFYRRSLGRLSARLAADVREELEEALCLQLAEVLKREVPPLVETLNVRRMVEEKINTLDILKVEGLLLGIMEEQFTYINLFGALLGALIGLVNLVVMGLH